MACVRRRLWAHNVMICDVVCVVWRVQCNVIRYVFPVSVINEVMCYVCDVSYEVLGVMIRCVLYFMCGLNCEMCDTARDVERVMPFV